MEIATLTPEIKEVEAGIAPVVAAANSLAITNTGEYFSATEFLKQIAGQKKKVNETLDPMVKAAHSAHKEAVALKATFTTPLENAERTVKGKISSYQQEQDRIRRAEEARLQSEARAKAEEEAMQAALSAPDPGTASEILDAAIEAPAPRVYVPPTVPAVSGVSTRKVWQFEVVDQSKVPAEFWILDTPAIGRAVRGGARDIPGVRIYSEDSVSVRA
jgi:hypothetical protein